MKQSSTIISVIVAAVVLLSAFAIGLYIRKVRQQRRTVESVTASRAVTELKTKQAEITTKPAREGRRSSRSLPPEQRAQLREQIENIRQRWASMSEAERKEFRAKMLEIFDAQRREAGSRFRGRPPQEGARFREELMQTKKRWKDMSEEERQEYRDKMRERSNAIRQGND